MEDIIIYLRNDEEVKQYKEKWKNMFKVPFPLYNYDCYGGIDDFKQKIKEALETGDYTIGNGKCRNYIY